MVQEQQQTVRKTTLTSLLLLEAINDIGHGTLSELADHTGLAVSTLHTHLHTLEKNEYVTRINGEYYLGMKLFNLGESARMRDPRYRLARQAASELADKVSEEVNFAIEEHGRSIILFDETGTSHTDEFQVGRYFHMHSSASGKAMLAQYSKDRIHDIIDQWGLPEHTDHTITDTDELFTELEQIREQGYAVNKQEELVGLRAVAMAIKEPDGSVFGTLDISGPVYRLPSDEELAAQLRPVVTELETTLAEYSG